MGVIIPHEGGFAVGITEKIEDLVGVLFLPIVSIIYYNTKSFNLA